jgi:DNA-binding GntR family transcriptional regulator
VCAASGNSRLYDFFHWHATELLILLRLDEGELGHEPNSIAGEHEDLADALRCGLPAAEAAFRSHLEDGRDRLAAYVGGTGTFTGRPLRLARTT